MNSQATQTHSFWFFTRYYYNIIFTFLQQIYINVSVHCNCSFSIFRWELLWGRRVTTWNEKSFSLNLSLNSDKMLCITEKFGMKVYNCRRNLIIYTLHTLSFTLIHSYIHAPVNTFKLFNNLSSKSIFIN